MHPAFQSRISRALAFLSAVQRAMRNFFLSNSIGEYPGDDDVLIMLHARDLVKGKTIVALRLHVSFSPDKTNAGYILMAKTVRLSGDGDSAGCLQESPIEETAEGMLAQVANGLLQCKSHL